MKEFLIALQFLTILPVRIKTKIENEEFGKSLVYFPVVGFLIGLILSFCAFIFCSLPNPVKGVIILLVSIFISGAIHLDGFADTCDGFFGSKDKEKILEIMQDSHIGAMGVIGIVGLLFFKYSLIISIPQDILWKSLIGMTTFARWSQVLLCYTSRYLRKQGKGKYFVEFATKRELFIATIFTLLVFLLLMSIKGVMLYLVSICFVFLWIGFIKKKIGGVTGDTIGATNELSEVCTLLFILMITR